MTDLHRHPHLLGHEQFDDVGGHPGCAQAGGDVGGLQIDGLHVAQSGDIAT